MRSKDGVQLLVGPFNASYQKPTTFLHPNTIADTVFSPDGLLWAVPTATGVVVYEVAALSSAAATPKFIVVCGVCKRSHVVCLKPLDVAWCVAASQERVTPLLLTGLNVFGVVRREGNWRSVSHRIIGNITSHHITFQSRPVPRSLKRAFERVCTLRKPLRASALCF